MARELNDQQLFDAFDFTPFLELLRQRGGNTVITLRRDILLQITGQFIGFSQPSAGAPIKFNGLTDKSGSHLRDLVKFFTRLFETTVVEFDLGK